MNGIYNAMKKLAETTNPETIKISVPDVEEERRIRSTYLHGELETKYGYDIFSFKTKAKLDERSATILKEEDTGKVLVFFLWHDYSWKKHTLQGLLVYLEDKKMFEDAFNKWNKNKTNI